MENEKTNELKKSTDFIIKYNKIQTIETDKSDSKKIKLFFNGKLNDLGCGFYVEGDEIDINNFLSKHNIKNIGQNINLLIFNKQNNLDEY
jgi:hypothetical protein